MLSQTVTLTNQSVVEDKCVMDKSKVIWLWFAKCSSTVWTRLAEQTGAIDLPVSTCNKALYRMLCIRDKLLMAEYLKIH